MIEGPSRGWLSLFQAGAPMIPLIGPKNLRRPLNTSSGVGLLRSVLSKEFRGAALHPWPCSNVISAQWAGFLCRPTQKHAYRSA